MPVETEPITVLSLERRDTFVETPYIKEIAERALIYLRAGFPVHLRGPAGIGKTTLALHIAHQLGQPVMLIHGDDELRSSDLIGDDQGYHRRTVFDNYIHSVKKWEEDVQQRWVDRHLTMACRYGFILVYDEFNRSRPEANNVLLSALEERLLTIPSMQSREGFVPVHPDFRTIFTSNPQEYAGVHDAQDALWDRMVTMELTGPDRETEAKIAAAKSGLEREHVEVIVDLVRYLRETEQYVRQASSMRSIIMLARASVECGIAPEPTNDLFVNFCVDILCSKMVAAGTTSQESARKCMVEAIQQVQGRTRDET